MKCFGLTNLSYVSPTLKRNKTDGDNSKGPSRTVSLPRFQTPRCRGTKGIGAKRRQKGICIEKEERELIDHSAPTGFTNYSFPSDRATGPLTSVDRYGVNADD